MEVLAVTTRAKDGREVVVRSVRPTEAAEALRYLRALFHESWRNLNHEADHFDRVTEGAEAIFLESAWRHPKSFLLGAFLGTEIVGTCGIQPSPATLARHTAELGISVAAHVRGQGIGRILMERLLFVAETNGLTNLTLRVRTFNAPAIALYESLGFERVGTVREAALLPEGPADEYLYQRISPGR